METVRVMSDAEILEGTFSDSYSLFSLNSTLQSLLYYSQKLCNLTGHSCSVSDLDFQGKFLLLLVICLFINIICLHIAWRVHGEQICDMFMKPGKAHMDIYMKLIDMHVFFCTFAPVIGESNFEIYQRSDENYEKQ